MKHLNPEREIPGMTNGVNSAVNRHQLRSLQEPHNHDDQLSSNFDPTSASQDEFLQQMLSTCAAFPWPEDDLSLDLEEDLADHHDSKVRHQQIDGSDVKALILQQQQQLLSRGVAAGGGMPDVDLNGIVDASDCANLTSDASIKAFLNGFTGSLGQTPNQSQHFHHAQGGQLNQYQNLSVQAASGCSGGGLAEGQPKQRVRARARRGQATDPHSIAERLRRERIAERMKSLQELVPNANKTDKASMLDEIIDYVKFLQLQVKVLSMSRLGGAAAVNPLVAAEGKNAASLSNNEGVTTAERQVAKLMEDDMGLAMQYLQGKGLCLMPISLATTISSAATHSGDRHNGEPARSSSSPTISVLSVGGNSRELSAPKLE